MPDTTEQATKPLRTWRPMAAWSAVIAVLLLGIYFLAPLAQLHYHAWRCRTGRDADTRSFQIVAAWAVKHQVTQGDLIRLLNHPERESESELLYLRLLRDISQMPPGSAISGSSVLYGFRMNAGRVVGFEKLPAEKILRP